MISRAAGLPRQHGGRDERDRHADGRSAGPPGIVPGHVHIPPPYPFRDGADARTAADTLAAAIEAEPAGTRGGVPGRAAARRRRLPGAARRLLAAGARGVRRLRRAADRRRGDDRLPSHRADVRVRPLGPRARPAGDGQGHERLLRAVRRARHRRPGGRDDRGRVPVRLHARRATRWRRRR